MDPTCTELQWRHHRPGPHLRWENVFATCLGEGWKRTVESIGWKALKGTFRDKAYLMFQARSFEDRYCKRKEQSSPTPPPKKKPRNVSRCPMLWSLSFSDSFRLEILGDSMLIINWLNGVWRCKYDVYDERLSVLHRHLESMITDFSAHAKITLTGDDIFFGSSGPRLILWQRGITSRIVGAALRSITLVTACFSMEVAQKMAQLVGGLYMARSCIMKIVWKTGARFAESSFPLGEMQPSQLLN